MQDHIYSLCDIFKSSFPGVTYTADNAKRKLLQMPLVALRLGQPSSGTSKLIVMEKFPHLNYQSLHKVLEEAQLNSLQQSAAISKPITKICTEWPGERHYIRYALYKASGLTPTGARRELGLQNMKSKSSEIEDCIQHCMSVHREFDQIVSTRLKLTLNMYDSDSCSDELDSDMDTGTTTSSIDTASLTENEISNLNLVMRQCDFNWFEFMEQVSCSNHVAEIFYANHLGLFSQEEAEQIKLSHEAFLAEEQL